MLFKKTLGVLCGLRECVFLHLKSFTVLVFGLSFDFEIINRDLGCSLKIDKLKLHWAGLSMIIRLVELESIQCL